MAETAKATATRARRAPDARADFSTPLPDSEPGRVPSPSLTGRPNLDGVDFTSLHSYLQGYEVRPGETTWGTVGEESPFVTFSSWVSTEQLTSIQSDIARVDRRLRRIEKILKQQPIQSVIVPIESLAPDPYRLVKPIPVVVEPVDEGEFTATFYDASIAAAGETRDEAVDGVRDLIASTYEMLLEHDPKRLGPLPHRQLAVLREFIVQED